MTAPHADRCHVCDRPIATAAQWRDHGSGCECAACVAACWDTGTAGCASWPVNWRERALAAEARERDAAHRERAAIVEWLLDRAYALPPAHVAASAALYEAADEIGAGKHEQVKP